MTRAVSMSEAESSVDAFLGGRVTLVQPKKGHRAGLDAALLQALVPSTAEGVAVDLGAGVGTVAFSIAARAPALSVVAIERDDGLVAFGREALGLSENAGFATRVSFVAGNVEDPGAWLDTAGLAEAGADFVLMNPPFEREGEASPSPDRRRAAAYIGPRDLFDRWCATALSLLKPGGLVGLIHRPDALAEILAQLTPRFGGIRIRPIHPREGADAGRILVTARKGRRTPLTLLPDLVLHAADGSWSSAADGILRGETELEA